MKPAARQLRPILFLVLLIAPFAVHADDIDKYVLTQLTERHVPGVAVTVIKNGRVVKMKGYGLASVEFNAPVTTETVFEIGSVSKQMTAAGIMLLVEDGKVNLDEKIAKYLPNTPEAWKDVTVRHLLTHTSGVKSYTSLDGFELSNRLKVADFIKLLSPHPSRIHAGREEYLQQQRLYIAWPHHRSAVGKAIYGIYARTHFHTAGNDKNR